MMQNQVTFKQHTYSNEQLIINYLIQNIFVFCSFLFHKHSSSPPVRFTFKTISAVPCLAGGLVEHQTAGTRRPRALFGRRRGAERCSAA